MAMQLALAVEQSETGRLPSITPREITPWITPPKYLQHWNPINLLLDQTKFYISSKYLLPPQRRVRSFLGVTLKGDLVEEADGGLRSCPIPF